MYVSIGLEFMNMPYSRRISGEHQAQGKGLWYAVYLLKDAFYQNLNIFLSIYFRKYVRHH